MELVDVAWLAGLLEGEGTFTVNQGGGSLTLPRIDMLSTDRDIVQRAASLLHTKANGPYAARPFGAIRATKPRYQLRLTKSSEAAGWMMTVYSFMGDRRKAKIREILHDWRTFQRKPAGRPRKQR